MKILNSLKLVCKFYLIFAMSGLSSAVFADSLTSTNSKMISAGTVLTQITRAQTEAGIRNFFKNSDVQKQLIKQGVAPDEILGRLATLSEHELQQLSGQIKEARAGGDILLAILVVVLIIYFIKRI